MSVRRGTKEVRGESVTFKEQEFERWRFILGSWKKCVASSRNRFNAEA